MNLALELIFNVVMGFMAMRIEEEHAKSEILPDTIRTRNSIERSFCPEQPMTKA